MDVRRYDLDGGGAEDVRTVVNEQAEDEGLWFIAETAAEAYLQQELRRLHAAIEAADKFPRCADGSLVHDFKGESSCPACGFRGIRSGDG